MSYIIYTRCSTEEQRKKGNSHQYQIEGIRRHPAIAGVTPVAIYSDTISGTTFSRPQLTKLYELCCQRRTSIDYIWVYKWDRFGRNLSEATSWVQKFKEIGVEVNCVESRIDFNDDNWPTLMGVIFGMAQSESLKISSRTKDGLYQAHKRGLYTATAPVGYIRKAVGRRNNGNKDLRLFPDPEKAPIVSRIFKEYLQGSSLKQLHDTYASKLGCSRSAFHRMFHNKIYAGIMDVPAYKNFPAMTVTCQHEPLISIADYQLLLQRHQQRVGYTVRSSDLYLKPLLIRDGKQYASYYSKGKRKRYGYYELKGIKGSIISATKSHTLVDSIMSTLRLDLSTEHLQLAEQVFLEGTEQLGVEVQYLEQEHARTIKQLEKIKNDYMRGDLPATIYSTMSEELSFKAADIAKSIRKNRQICEQETKTAKAFSNTLKNLFALYQKASKDGRVSILKAVFPEGFYITTPEYEFRTPCINEVINLLCSESAFYEKIKNTAGEKIPSTVLEGGRWDVFRTHMKLIMTIAS